MKVFLGGTCTSIWRDILIPSIRCEYFNPIVDDWDEEAKAEERKQRETCDYCLYVITPAMSGYYSIAEAIDDSNKRPEKTIFCVLADEYPFTAADPLATPYSFPSAKVNFSRGEMYSFDEIGAMVVRNGGRYFKSLADVSNFLNRNTD